MRQRGKMMNDPVESDVQAERRQEMAAADTAANDGGVPKMVGGVGARVNIPDDSSMSSYGSDNDEPPTSDTFMTLTKAERNLAKQLKAAVLSNNDDDGVSIPNANIISDFEFVHQALFLMAHADLYHIDTSTGTAPQETVEKTLQRISDWQHFRQQFDVQDNQRDATETMETYLERHPGLLLHIAADYGSINERGEPSRQGCVIVQDVKEWNWDSAVQPPEINWRTFVVAHYYTKQASFPHFGAMREGVLMIFETEGRRWEDDISFSSIRYHRRLHNDLLSFFPEIIKSFQLYNSTSLANMLHKLCKPFAKASLRRKVQVGLTLDEEAGGRLSDLFASNTPETLLSNTITLLQERWHNEASFVLE